MVFKCGFSEIHDLRSGFLGFLLSDSRIEITQSEQLDTGLDLRSGFLSVVFLKSAI